MILDRCGFGVNATLTVTAGPNDDGAHHTTRELLARAELLASALREQLEAEAVQPLHATSDEGAVDGVVVTDGDDVESQAVARSCL